MVLNLSADALSLLLMAPFLGLLEVVSDLDDLGEVVLFFPLLSGFDCVAKHDEAADVLEVVNVLHDGACEARRNHDYGARRLVD